MPLHDSGRAKPPNEPQHHAARPAPRASSIVKRSKRPGGIPGARAPSEPAKATAAQQELRPPNNQSHRTRDREAPSEPAKATAAQQELRPPKNQGHRTRKGEAPSEPDGATARHRRLAVPESCKGIHDLLGQMIGRRHPLTTA
jgi:hypothetical protein